MKAIDPAVSAHYTGDCRKLLKRLPDKCVQVCITSPPFWGLRDYEHEQQIGLEDTPEAYVAELVAVFMEVHRVLRDDGTLWLNLGDCYHSSGGHTDTTCNDRRGQYRIGTRPDRPMSQTKGIDPKNPRKGAGSNNAPNRRRHPKLKHKDLVGVPWMAAFALRDAGYYLRMDNIWHKPNPMPESVADRTTKAHEYLFHFSKSATYYYDALAIAEPTVWEGQHRNIVTPYQTAVPGAGPHTGLRKYKSGNKERKSRAEYGGADRNSNQKFSVPWTDEDGRRNKRSVWTVVTQPYEGAHFATFPPALIEPCILACSRPGDLVLDPFFGSGTTGMVAEKHERRWIGFDINPKYAELAKQRTSQRSLPLSRSGG